jgi:hypothetical protein
LQQFRGTDRSRTQQQALSQFLVDHPSLSWLQNVFIGDYKQASNTLRDLAREETELLQRKKVVLYVTASSIKQMFVCPHVSSSRLLKGFQWDFCIECIL